MDDEKKDFGRVMHNTSQDSNVSLATDSVLCSTSQNSDGVSPCPVAPELRGDEMLVSSVSRDVEPQTVAELQADVNDGRSYMTEGADDGDDFGDFTNGVMIEEFAEFESPLVDEPAGSWDTVTQPVPAVIGNDVDDYDFDDFETAEFQCAPVNCVGIDDGRVSISCVSSSLGT